MQPGYAMMLIVSLIFSSKKRYKVNTGHHKAVELYVLAVLKSI